MRKKNMKKRAKPKDREARMPNSMVHTPQKIHRRKLEISAK
jgi:hypothetical protein